MIHGEAPRLGKSVLGEAGEYIAGWQLDKQADAELEEQGRGIVPADWVLDAPDKKGGRSLKPPITAIARALYIARATFIHRVA